MVEIFAQVKKGEGFYAKSMMCEYIIHVCFRLAMLISHGSQELKSITIILIDFSLLMKQFWSHL
jgi:hypothetical protein